MEREEGLASDQAVLPVDHALLLAAVRNEIPDEQARPIFRLVHTSPAWHAAYRQILLAEARAEGQP